MKLRLIGAAMSAALLAGCMVGPNYQRPPIDLPATYRGQLAPAEVGSLGDEPWWNVFSDPALQALVRTALANNLDLRIAVARIEQAQAQVKVVNAPIFPQLGYSGGVSRQRVPDVTSSRVSSFNYSNAVGGAALSWELDIWGRVQRSTESAQAQLLATEDFQRGVTITLLASVASAYFDLLMLDRELEIARATVVEYAKTVKLFHEKSDGGASSLLPLNRASAQLANAAADIPALERQVVDTENRLSILLGRAPGPIARGQKLDAQRMPPAIPAGLPSQLLTRRPDVRRSEDVLISQNALVGVAQANFYPSISLTGAFGGQSSSVSSIVSGSSSIWSFGAGLVGPIFTAGRLVGEYEVAEARWKEAKASYEQTLLNAVGEVAGALNAQQKLKEIRVSREIAVRELQSSVDLALQRYLIGLASYFEVLQAEEQLYASQQALAQVQAEQLTNVVALYRALGGGWQNAGGAAAQ